MKQAEIGGYKTVDEAIKATQSAKRFGRRLHHKHKGFITYIVKGKTSGYYASGKPRNYKWVVAAVFPDGSVVKEAKHKVTR